MKKKGLSDWFNKLFGKKVKWDGSKDTIEKDEVKEILRQHVSRIRTYPLDRRYVLPTWKWVRSLSYHVEKEIIRRRGSLDYEKEVNDCDDFALCMASIIRDFFAKKYKHKYDGGLAVGIMRIKNHMNRGTNHIVCFLITPDKELIMFDRSMTTIGDPEFPTSWRQKLSLVKLEPTEGEEFQMVLL